MALSRLVLKAVYLAEGKTSIKLEPEFWEILEGICRHECLTINTMVDKIDSMRDKRGLRASAIRVFILKYLELRVSGGPSVARDFLADDNVRNSSSLPPDEGVRA